MKSKFQRISIITQIVMASTVGTVCAQTLSPLRSNYGTPQVAAPESQLPESLPPIVRGTQNNRVPPIVDGIQPRNVPQSLPPIVNRQQNRMPQVVNGSQFDQGAQRTPPIVSGSQRSTVMPGVQQQQPTNIQPQASGYQLPSQLNSNLPSNQSGQINPLRPIQLGRSMNNQSSPTGQVPMGQTQVVPQNSPAMIPPSSVRPQASQMRSTSGVPLYSSGQPRKLENFRVEQPSMPGEANPNFGTRESGMGSPMPRMRQDTVMQQPNSVAQPAEQFSVPRATSPNQSSVMIPNETQDRSLLPGENSVNSVMSRAIPNEASPNPVVSAQPTGDPSYFDMGQGAPMAAPGGFTPGCQDCIAAGGSANCPTCNPQGGFTGRRGDTSRGYFGAMSCARRYGEIDLLLMTRTDGSLVFSNAGGLGSFDWDLGWRATFGQRDDATQGREISYFGTSDLSKSANRFDPGGRLDALFAPVSVIDDTLTAPFFDANVQNERMETRLHSFELNRVTWAWDVVKSFIGVRFIHVDDSYNLFSQRGVNDAEYDLSSKNNMLGVHIGRELFYDVGYRLSFSALGKAGVYANANRFSVNVSNNGVTFLSNRNNDSTFSTSLELLLTGHYQINRRARLRLGYQALLLDEVFTISDNLTGTLSPFFGSRQPDKDSMFFHGFNLGLEFYR